MAGTNKWMLEHYEEYYERMASRARERYAMLKENHQCVFCRAQLENGYTNVACPICREKHRASAPAKRARRYKRRKEEHRCTTCGVQLLSGDPNIECEKCRERRLRRRREKRAMRRAEHEQSD